tara:strand:+ start:115 stop:771 length:657 start_codon:yes stop_codon:yes gene_type:complete
VEIVALTLSLIGLWVMTGIIGSYAENKEKKSSNNRFEESNKNEIESSPELWEKEPFFIEFWKKSFDFKSKTNRKVFWLTILQVSCIYVGGVLLFYFAESGESIESAYQFTWLFAIFSFIPNLSIQIRRLNDIGKEPVWVLLSLIPFASLILIFWYVKPSQKSQLNGNKKRKDFNSINTISLIDLTNAEEKLLKIKDMLDRGVISAEEYEELRKKTLGL